MPGTANGFQKTSQMFTSGHGERLRPCMNLTCAAAPAAEPRLTTADAPPVVFASFPRPWMPSTVALLKPAAVKRRARTDGSNRGSSPRTRISGDRLERTPAERTTAGSSDGDSTCFAIGIVAAETCCVEDALFLPLLPQPVA